jgi:hypothetical protein
MIKYTVLDIQSNAENGGVYFVYWMANLDDGFVDPKTDTLVTTSQTGSCNFVPDPNAAEYVPFSELTEEQVLNWIKGTIDIEAIEQELMSRHEAAKTSTRVCLPWKNKAQAQTDAFENSNG